MDNFISLGTITKINRQDNGPVFATALLNNLLQMGFPGDSASQNERHRLSLIQGFARPLETQFCPTLESKSFYQLPLPTSPQAGVVHVAFTSCQSQAYLICAILAGSANNYFYLADQHLTQSEPTSCGLATICLILNAAAIDPQQPWKSIWRWYDEEMLDAGCLSLASVKQAGMTMDEFSCLARRNMLHAVVIRKSTLEDFRRDVMESTSSHGRKFLAACYSRSALGQIGDGHFSPIAAYTGKADDMVLVLDVARYKYGSYWLPLEAVWNAMNTIDKASGQMRGYCMLSKAT